MEKITFIIVLLVSSNLFAYADFDKVNKLKNLSTLQCSVTQKNNTEPSFKNKYWDNNQPGIYVDVVSGEPLFCSCDKYKSGTGWPSFKKPLNQKFIKQKVEARFIFGKRIEIRSKYADSHLGHLFNDGPKPLGLRYCITCLCT